MRLPLRPALLACTLAVLAVVCIWLWRAWTSEPLAGFKSFPWTYISESAMGADETRVIINRGTVSGPASVVDPASGGTAWPAYYHPDPAVVPLVGGKPFIFPMLPAGPQSCTPVIPALKRRLSEKEMAGVRRYLTPEGEERMAAFRKGINP